MKLSWLCTFCEKYLSLWSIASVITLWQLGYNSNSFVPALSLLLLLGYKVWDVYWGWKLSNYPKPLQSLLELEAKLSRLELTLEEVRQKTNNVSLAVGFKPTPRKSENV